MKFPARPSWLRHRPPLISSPDSPVLANGHAAHPPTIAPKAPPGPPESILCFAADILDNDEMFAPGRFCGFRSDASEMVSRLFPRPVQAEDLLRRDLVEDDESIKQVIACVVPWHAPTRQVWAYHRGGSEGRLEGKVSCLVGGHVNLDDLHAVLQPPLLVADLADVLWAAALRELGEELEGWKGNWKSHHSDCRLILAGVVNDDGPDSTPVDRVHFGFVYRLDMARLDIPMAFARDAGRAIGWVPVDGLAGRARGLGIGEPETWTRHVCRHLAETSPARSSC